MKFLRAFFMKAEQLGFLSESATAIVSSVFIETNVEAEGVLGCKAVSRSAYPSSSTGSDVSTYTAAISLFSEF